MIFLQIQEVHFSFNFDNHVIIYLNTTFLTNMQTICKIIPIFMYLSFCTYANIC